jgi:phosphate starvation-inducible PhoH-like protein
MSRRKQTRTRNERSENSGFKPKKVVARTEHQKDYIKNIIASDIAFATGPAGSGKTHIAIGMAVDHLKSGKVSRIILSRPAVDSGTSLGYLPGTMEDKMAPYLAPLYDELSYYIEMKNILAWVEHKVIEIVPLSLMRGRTFNGSFIVLDEAQNALMSELRMCMTRIGVNSKLVVTGDLTQSDLYADERGGLERCIKALCKIDGISVTSLTADDIVRNPLIAKIEAALAKGTASCSRATKGRRS